MKAINLLPKVPFLVKHRDFLLLLIIIVGVIAISTQLVFTYVWNTSRSVAELTVSQSEMSIERLTARTTKDPRTAQYDQAVLLVEQVKDKHPDWLPVIDSILQTTTLKGQLTSLQITAEHLLLMNSIYLSEEDATKAIAMLESDPNLGSMKLSLTQHHMYGSDASITLWMPNKTEFKVTNRDYYSLQLEIMLSEKRENVMAGDGNP